MDVGGLLASVKYVTRHARFHAAGTVGHSWADTDLTIPHRGGDLLVEAFVTLTLAMAMGPSLFMIC